ncbi:hypothetical protein ACOSP7_020621 [Xanthoceras sorbifolium]
MAGNGRVVAVMLVMVMVMMVSMNLVEAAAKIGCIFKCTALCSGRASYAICFGDCMKKCKGPVPDPFSTCTVDCANLQCTNLGSAKFEVCADSCSKNCYKSIQGLHN